MKIDLFPLEPVGRDIYNKTDIPCVCGKEIKCYGDSACMMESTSKFNGDNSVKEFYFVLDEGEYKEASIFTPYELEIARRENRLYKKPRS